MNKCLISKELMQDKELTKTDKQIYAHLTTYMDRQGVANINLDQLAKETDTTRRRAAEGIKKLKERKYIEDTEYDIVYQLKNKGVAGKGVGTKQCSWCKIYTTVLEEHHYPTPRSRGGTQTIEICPNCHREFHYHTTPVQINLPPKIIAVFHKVGENLHD